ncbi:MAG: AAA family ATPase [Candidatus Thorarchaeota archaeon]|jgi:DNA repair exonuclease SbcCD ATPase subunit
MIQKITLRDFKVFHDQTFELTPGTTSIVGPNGSGKTSVLEAIEFALFRQITRKEKTIKGVEELIRHGRKKATIELEFVAPKNRRTYRIVRVINPKRTSADLYLEKKKEPVESGAKRVDAEVISLLGMDRHAFAALTYVRQGEIDLLSRLSPKDRQENLYDMMGLGVYGKTEGNVQKHLREMKKEIKSIAENRTRLVEIRELLPTGGEVDEAFASLDTLRDDAGDSEGIKPLEMLLQKVRESVAKVEDELASPELTERKEELEEDTSIANHLKQLLGSIPGVAEEQLRPHIRHEAREIFLRIFGDRYSDFVIDDGYDVALYNLRGNRVSLRAASGGEDVCVNFALRVAVNTALQRHSIAGPPPGVIILDEPGAGLDAQRRRWLPEAVQGLDSVEQVIVVTHMEELKESADRVISLTPQGKGRQPLVEVSE